MRLSSRLVTSTLVLILLCAAQGCADHRATDTALATLTIATQTVEITGGTVKPDEKFTADLPLVFHVTHLSGGGAEEYDLLLAPLPSGGAASAEFLPTSSSVEIYEGFGYFLGTHPTVKTKRVIAAAEGSRMIVQRDGAVDRVFLLEGDSVDLEIPGSTNNSPPIDQVDHYVEATGTGGSITISSPQQIPTSATDPLRKFVNDVLTEAQKAGL